MAWNDERVDLLKKLWSDGLSASQIAGRLGGVTRNAVIGKVHRLGLSGQIPMLTAESTLLEARRQMAALVTQAANQRVTLLLSIGGGYNSEQPGPDSNSRQDDKP